VRLRSLVRKCTNQTEDRLCYEDICFREKKVGEGTMKRGKAERSFFWSVAATYAALRMETWNDSLNQKKLGPTYGFTITLDLLKLFGHT